MPLTEILDHAKEALLESGEHPPMVIVEGIRTRAVFVLTMFGGETSDKMHQLFQAGHQGAQASGITLPVTLYLVTETWVSQISDGAPYVRPRDNPARKEALMIATFHAATKRQEVYLYEMLRDGSGKLQDLALLTSTTEGVKSDLLPSFLAGFLDGQRQHARKN